MLKVLMAGLGGIGQRHLRNLRTVLGNDVEIAAYRVLRTAQVLTDTLRVEEGSEVERKYGIAVFSSLDEACAWGPDAAFICNPTSLHLPVALAVARAGAHLMLEKPLSHSLEGVNELIEIVERQKLVGLVGYQMRFHPCLQMVKGALDAARIGNVLAVHAEVGAYMPGWHTYEDYRTSYASRADLGGGVVLSQIHEIDFLGWLFGPPVRVFALGGHLSSLEIDVEDISSALLECRAGHRHIPVHLHQDYLQRPSSRLLQILGDKGKIHLDFEKLTCAIFAEEGEIAEHRDFTGFQRNQLFIDELNHFLRCMQGLEAPLISLRDGASSLATALAIKESIATGKVITLS